MNVCIVGSGFSGTMVAVHLSRHSTVSTDISIVERTGRFGAGVAYATPYACHLLNVPAARMSAFPDAPGHFLRWAQARDRDVRPETFLPRQLYSAYLADVLDDARVRAGAGTAIRRVDGEVTGIDRVGIGWRVRTSDGRLQDVDVVVLAIGNFPPAPPSCETPSFYDSPAFIRDPWAPDALAIDAAHDLLLLGTGLTMIDIVVALRDQGHRGTVTAVSRRGLVPQWLRESAVVPHDIEPPTSLATWPRTARGLVRGFRRAVDERTREGGDWRDVVASLRAPTAALWTSLPLAERRRLLRHVRPYWETHRHGAAPAIGRVVDELRATGRLRVLAGRVRRFERAGDTVAAAVHLRGGTRVEDVRVHRVINCTGPETNLARFESALVADLQRQGRLRPDPLGIGLMTDDHGRLIGADGSPQPDLYLTGPLRRGRTWEHVAVPELRDSAQILARHLAERLNMPRGLTPSR